MSEKKPFKLNLGALQNTNINEVKHQSNETIELENIELEKNNFESKNNIEEKEINTNIHKLDLNKIKKTEKKEKTKEEKESIELKEKQDIENRKIEKEKLKEEQKEVFSNYESDFKKEKTTILENINKFKNFVKPKTRLGFIAMLLGITFMGIASLFLIAPEVHNFQNYKTNLLLAKQKLECKIDKNKCKKEEKIEKKSVTKEIINSKTLKKEIFVIEFKTKIVNGKEIIIYDGKEYSKEKFELKIKEIIEKRKLEKLKEHFKNKK